MKTTHTHINFIHPTLARSIISPRFTRARAISKLQAIDVLGDPCGEPAEPEPATSASPPEEAGPPKKEPEHTPEVRPEAEQPPAKAPQPGQAEQNGEEHALHPESAQQSQQPEEAQLLPTEEPTRPEPTQAPLPEHAQQKKAPRESTPVPKTQDDAFWPAVVHGWPILHSPGGGGYSLGAPRVISPSAP